MRTVIKWLLTAANVTLMFGIVLLAVAFWYDGKMLLSVLTMFFLNLYASLCVTLPRELRKYHAAKNGGEKADGL